MVNLRKNRNVFIFFVFTIILLICISLTIYYAKENVVKAASSTSTTVTVNASNYKEGTTTTIRGAKTLSIEAYEVLKKIYNLQEYYSRYLELTTIDKSKINLIIKELKENYSSRFWDSVDCNIEKAFSKKDDETYFDVLGEYSGYKDINIIQEKYVFTIDSSDAQNVFCLYWNVEFPHNIKSNNIYYLLESEYENFTALGDQKSYLDKTVNVYRRNNGRNDTFMTYSNPGLEPIYNGGKDPVKTIPVFGVNLKDDSKNFDYTTSEYDDAKFYSRSIDALSSETYHYINGTETTGKTDTRIENENENENVSSQGDIIAYILSDQSSVTNPADGDHDNSDGKIYFGDHEKQMSMWRTALDRVQDRYESKYPDEETLYKTAKKYQEYREKLEGKEFKDTVKLEYDKNKLKYTQSGDYTYIGPYYIEYGYGKSIYGSNIFAGITGAKVYGKQDLDSEKTIEIKEFSLVNSNKNAYTGTYKYPKSGTNFYIKISSDYIKENEIKSISKLSIYLQEMKAEAKYYTIRDIFVNYIEWQRRGDTIYAWATNYSVLTGVNEELISMDSNENSLKLLKTKGNDLKEYEEEDIIPRNIIYPIYQQDLLILEEATRKYYDMSIGAEMDIKLTMDLSGKVWLDEPSSGKDPSAANGKMASTEKKVQGVKVYLCDSNGTVITDTDIVAKNPVTTDKNGYYEFKEIPIDNYKIKFEYNGMLYIATKNVKPKNKEEEKIVSKATEIGRTSYNKKFNTITLNNAYGSAGNIKLSYADGSSQENPRESILNTGTKVTEYSSYIKLETTKETKQVTCGVYNSYTGGSSSEKKCLNGHNKLKVGYKCAECGALLNVYSNGCLTNTCEYFNSSYDKPSNHTKTATVDSTTYNNFKIQSQTGVYSDTTTNINFGIVERDKGDLSLTTNVNTATIRLNGKVTKYAYDGSNVFNTIPKESTPGWLSTKQSNKLEIRRTDYTYSANMEKIYSSDAFLEGRLTVENDLYKYSNDLAELKDGMEHKKLEVEVQYKISVTNNSAIRTAKVNQIKYYYDSRYVKAPIKLEGATWTQGSDATINGKTYHTGIINLSDTLNKAGGKKDIYITLKLDTTKSMDALQGECRNYAEIYSYHIDKGLIDKNSQPGNLVSNGKFNEKLEDDESYGTKFEITFTDEDRNLSGYVWDDTATSGYGNGIKNTNEKVIDNVTVQLIELKPKKTIAGTTNYYEYLWQEMKSGTDTVTRIKLDGTGIENAKITKENGKYIFNKVIPGDYIIRFIYGDGTVKDIYNGQDYKSTKCEEYNAEYLNLGNIDSTNAESKARDNEARRLQVINYSRTVDNTIGNNLKALANKNGTVDTYKATWMCSETPKINVAIEMREDNSSSSTQDYYWTVFVKNNYYKIENINFGLEERQKNDVELEKAVSRVKLTLADGQVIVDTANGLNQNVNDVKPLDPKKYRGTISLYLDEGIMHGATIEITYKYTVKNTGEVDYTTSNLEIAKTKENIESYITDINSARKQGTYHKTIGNYIGKTYYTDVKTTGEITTKTKATIVEYIPSNIKMAEGNDNKWKLKTLPTGAEKNYSAIITRETGEIEVGKNETFELTVSKVLSPNSETLSYLSNTAEVVKFLNNVGRRDMDSIPESHASIADPGENPKSAPVEDDEAWAQTVTILPPFGGNMNNTMYYILGTIAVLTLAGGIILIKKLVLKNK